MEGPLTSLSEIVQWMNEQLAVRQVQDIAENGLQVEGRPQVRRVVTGVSANLALLNAAVERGADLIVVHHGLIWGGIRRIEGPLRQRLALLLRENISLAAYHLPLDLHPTLGNNAGLFAALELGARQPFGRYKGQLIGVRGAFTEPLSTAECLSRIATITGQTPRHLEGGPARIHTVAICSGGAADLVEEAIATGCDLFLSGEVAEYSPALAREGRIHVVGAGHHATERFGVRALGTALTGRFGIEASFVDIANEL